MSDIVDYPFVSKSKNKSMYGTSCYELMVVKTNLGYQLTLKSPEGQIIENHGIVVTNGTVVLPSELRNIIFRCTFVDQTQEYDWLNSGNNRRLPRHQPWTKQAKHTKGFVSTKPKPKVPKFLTSLIKNINQEP